LTPIGRRFRYLIVRLYPAIGHSIVPRFRRVGCTISPRISSRFNSAHYGHASDDRQLRGRTYGYRHYDLRLSVLTAARNSRFARGSYAETSQQPVDEAKVHQPQTVALWYAAMTDASPDLLKRCEFRDRKIIASRHIVMMRHANCLGSWYSYLDLCCRVPAAFRLGRNLT